MPFNIEYMSWPSVCVKGMVTFDEFLNGVDFGASSATASINLRHLITLLFRACISCDDLLNSS